MSKIQIDIPTKEYNILKQNAKADDRSLVNYVTNLLKKIANGETELIKLSELPENAVLKTKIQKPEPEPILSEEEIQEQKQQAYIALAEKLIPDTFNQLDFDIYDYMYFTEDHSYFKYAEPTPGKYHRAAYNMPLEKQEEYLKEVDKWIRTGR